MQKRKRIKRGHAMLCSSKRLPRIFDYSAKIFNVPKPPQPEKGRHTTRQKTCQEQTKINTQEPAARLNTAWATLGFCDCQMLLASGETTES